MDELEQHPPTPSSAYSQEEYGADGGGHTLPSEQPPANPTPLSHLRRLLADSGLEKSHVETAATTTAKQTHLGAQQSYGVLSPWSSLQPSAIPPPLTFVETLAQRVPPVQAPMAEPQPTIYSSQPHPGLSGTTQQAFELPPQVSRATVGSPVVSYFSGTNAPDSSRSAGPNAGAHISTPLPIRPADNAQEPESDVSKKLISDIKKKQSEGQDIPPEDRLHEALWHKQVSLDKVGDYVDDLIPPSEFADPDEVATNPADAELHFNSSVITESLCPEPNRGHGIRKGKYLDVISRLAERPESEMSLASRAKNAFDKQAISLNARHQEFLKYTWNDRSRSDEEKMVALDEEEKVFIRSIRELQNRMGYKDLDDDSVIQEVRNLPATLEQLNKLLSNMPSDEASEALRVLSEKHGTGSSIGGEPASQPGPGDRRLKKQVFKVKLLESMKFMAKNVFSIPMNPLPPVAESPSPPRVTTTTAPIPILPVQRGPASPTPSPPSSSMQYVTVLGAVEHEHEIPGIEDVLDKARDRTKSMDESGRPNAFTRLRVGGRRRMSMPTGKRWSGKGKEREGVGE